MSVMDAGRTLELAVAVGSGHITRGELRELLLLDLLCDGGIAEEMVKFLAPSEDSG